MARHRYLIRFPNGFSRHISSTELATHSGLEKIGPREYFAPSLQESLSATKGPNYLAGLFLWQLADLLEYERLQTSKGQIEQLEAMGWKPA